MWFKNLQIYRLPARWAMAADQLASHLESQSFAPCASNEMLRQGFAEPREGCGLVYEVNKQFLLRFVTEKRLLPASVVNQVARERAAELEEQQGFPPGKKAMKEIKERVADELLPRAFGIRSDTFAWIDPVNGWLVVDAASASKADDVLKHLLKAIPKFPVESVRVAHSPARVMTSWLELDEAPAGFTVDQDADMVSAGESKAKVKYVRHTLQPDDLRRHIAAGKLCTRLALTWNDKISFVLTESLAIKSVKALDVLKENDSVTRDNNERFDNDMLLMTGELNQMLAAVLGALGGEVGDLVSPARETASSRSAGPHQAVKALNKLLAEDGATATLTGPNGATVTFGGNGPDPLYDQAVEVVLSNRRASISLVQRHLTIGYNRAARLMEAMEAKGVVSPMQSNGHREVLVGADG